MNKKILIALFDENLAGLISQKLSIEGYASIFAKTGEEALEKMRNESPAAALIDLVLNGKNGYDVLNEKSFDRMITKIPVIVVSNSGSPIDMGRLPSTSNIVKNYIIKTHIEPEEVMEKIREIAVSEGKPEEKAENKQEGKPQATAGGKKILWVEDDKLLGSILFKKFQSSGHTVLFAKDSDETFALLEKDTPDIIILDIMLPGMNGFDILQKIKSNEKLRNVPAIMLSNISKESDIEKAKKLGAQKFLVKVAVSLDEIIKEVNSLL
ncbi:MAG: response regulator [bacterium]|nr:response regulator [bacterium]